jgi:hypothetical protein
MNEIKQITDADYRQAEGVSISWLKLFDVSPNHAKYYKYESKRMQMGTLIHDYMFDDELFKQENVIAPEMYMDEKTGEWMPIINRLNKPFPSFKKDNPDKNIILQKELVDLEGMKKNLLKYKIYDNLTFECLFENSLKEISFFWESTIDGIIVQKKGRADLLYRTYKYNIIIDYKSISSCLDFWYQNRKLQYYRQDAHYSEGIEAITGLPTIFIFLTFETVAPYGVMARQNGEYWKHEGEMANLRSMINYIKWMNEGRPEQGYPEGIHPITQNRQDCL